MSKKKQVKEDFRRRSTLIEDDIIAAITIHHYSTDSTIVRSLIDEWKLVYKQTYKREITDKEFESRYICKFVSTHMIHEAMVKECK